ncbi:helix-turn-helix domain-containing protein [Robbsia sp. Bb-Pol-6]|uniref:Helix-turn-helix domain-containing protein n=1 Tax=Robbsia betulipollinis TaxID=2981849 RepID=A0ABT3ZI64_9BURK|nr:helix-turn-helix domain-containing protein [Robbsia betulipollinis]MCY0386042.1 helix-turn-helix domain-containing protein [Robbsia betulipollinis]
MTMPGGASHAETDAEKGAGADGDAAAGRRIHILAFHDVQLLDVCGPLQVFASANACASARGMPRPYDAHVVAAGGSVLSSAGPTLSTLPLARAPARADTLIVAGGEGVMAASGDAELRAWVRAHAAHARRLASVCSGAFLLAAAGLLDGRRVVTHWAHCDALARRYPSLRVERDPIFIQDGDVWSSAGVTAGIDLTLAFVEADLGRALALHVARHLVVFLKRPGGQNQFSTTLALQESSERFGTLFAWIADHLGEELPVGRLAERAGMSERSFVRHFRADTGRTPARAVERMRVEAACRLLAETAVPVKRIAARCGFGSEETLRRGVLRIVGVAPQDYRERFGTGTGTGAG